MPSMRGVSEGSACREQQDSATGLKHSSASCAPGWNAQRNGTHRFQRLQPVQTTRK